MNQKAAPIFLIFTLLVATLMVIPSVKAAPLIWSDEIRLTTNVTLDGYPSIAQMNDGRIWIAWKARRDGNSNIYYKIYNWKWSDDKRLTTDIKEDISPSITQLKNLTIWVVWPSNRMSSYDLFYKSSSDNGLSWSNDTRLTTSGNNYQPSVLQTSDGKIWVAWMADLTTTYDIYYKVFNGSTWSNDTPLITDSSLDNNPVLIQTQNGKIWIIWSSNRSGDFEIYYKTFDGTTWSPDEPLTTDTKKDDTDPAIFQTVDGVIWVIWASSAFSPTATDDLYYKTSSDNGSTWSATTQFTTNPSDDTWPAAIQARDKSIWIIWGANRDSDGNWDLFYKTTLLGDVNNSGSIDMEDLALIARALLTAPASGGTPGDWWAWNPACDLTNDGIVDGLDLAIAGKNYGRFAPP